MDWIIVTAPLLVILLFVLILMPWKKLRDHFLPDERSSMNENDLVGWHDDSVVLYRELVNQEYDRRISEENEIHTKASYILMIDGIILAFMSAFVVPVLDNSFVKGLSALSVFLLMLSILFAIWIMYHTPRIRFDERSHQIGYNRHRMDPIRLRKEIVKDLLASLESLMDIVIKKKRRLTWALHFLISAMFAIFITFCGSLFL